MDPGGEFSMGAAVNGEGSNEMPMASNDAGPVHRARVDGIWMDSTPVTNEQFEKFVKGMTDCFGVSLKSYIQSARRPWMIAADQKKRLNTLLDEIGTFQLSRLSL